MGIKHWPGQLQPREKLLRNGATTLSDAELLAIFLAAGYAGQSAVSVGSRLLADFGSIRGVVSANLHDLTKTKGVGPCKYIAFQAAVELARRHFAEALNRGAVFSQSAEVERFVHAQLRDLKHEAFGLLLLDSQHQMIAFRIMFNGTINSAAVYPREIVRQVIHDNAAAIILVHNHPSGVAEPSDADVRLTRDVVQAMALIDVAVLDHFVVGDTSTVSFAQRGLM